jgi:hypothetical protein
MRIVMFLWSIVLLAIGLGVAVVLYTDTSQSGVGSVLFSAATGLLGASLGLLKDVVVYLAGEVRKRISGG